MVQEGNHVPEGVGPTALGGQRGGVHLRDVLFTSCAADARGEAGIVVRLLSRQGRAHAAAAYDVLPRLAFVADGENARATAVVRPDGRRSRRGQDLGGGDGGGARIGGRGAALTPGRRSVALAVGPAPQAAFPAPIG